MKHLLEYDKYVQPVAPINEGFLDDLYPKFVQWVKGWYNKIFGDGKPAAPSQGVASNIPSELMGEHMLYVPHQQGGRRTAKLFLAAKGKYKLENEDIEKLKANMPSSDPGFSVLNNASKSSAEKALAYFRYWKKQWEKYEKDAKENIAKYPEVKKGIEKSDAKHPKNFSTNFLTTVAWIESRFKKDAGAKGKQYKGLYQIGPLAFQDLKKNFKDREYVKKKAIPMDVIENPQMGNDYLKYSYDRFKSNLAELEKELANKK